MSRFEGGLRVPICYLVVMGRVILLLAAAAMSLLVACGSKHRTQQDAKTAEEREQSTGREGRTKYYDWEGSPYNSAEEAGAQLEGD